MQGMWGGGGDKRRLVGGRRGRGKKSRTVITRRTEGCKSDIITVLSRRANKPFPLATHKSIINKNSSS